MLVHCIYLHYNTLCYECLSYAAVKRIKNTTQKTQGVCVFANLTEYVFLKVFALPSITVLED